MIAGAPGACGSLVILSSSGETGWNPTARAAIGLSMANARTDTNAENVTAGGRSLDMADFTWEFSSAADPRALRGKAKACADGTGNPQHAALQEHANAYGTGQYSGLAMVSR